MIVCRVLLGFMLPTWFLSMWLSNTATTGMMIPVAEQVIEQMEENCRRRYPETAAAYAQRGQLLQYYIQLYRYHSVIIPRKTTLLASMSVLFHSYC